MTGCHVFFLMRWVVPGGVDEFVMAPLHGRYTFPHVYRFFEDHSSMTHIFEETSPLFGLETAGSKFRYNIIHRPELFDREFVVFKTTNLYIKKPDTWVYRRKDSPELTVFEKSLIEDTFH